MVERMTSDFKTLVNRYSTLSDELAAASKTMRELRSKARELGDNILEFMQKEGIDEVSLENGKLTRRVSKRTAPLTKELIAAELKKHVDESKLPEVIQNIMERRETSESATLKRLKN